MNNKTINNIASIANHYGYEYQVRQLTEEMAELTVAFNKQWRALKDKTLINGRTNSNGKIYEELADVSIMLKQIIYLGNCEKEVDDIIEEKVKRQLERIRGESNDSVW